MLLLSLYWIYIYLVHCFFLSSDRLFSCVAKFIDSINKWEQERARDREERKKNTIAFLLSYYLFSSILTF